MPTGVPAAGPAAAAAAAAWPAPRIGFAICEWPRRSRFFCRTASLMRSTSCWYLKFSTKTAQTDVHRGKVKELQQNVVPIFYTTLGAGADRSLQVAGMQVI